MRVRVYGGSMAICSSYWSFSLNNDNNEENRDPEKGTVSSLQG